MNYLLCCSYLHAFEDFYRKLGLGMGSTIGRPSRSRVTSGRASSGLRSVNQSPKASRGSSSAASKKDTKKDEDAEAEVML